MTYEHYDDILNADDEELQPADPSQRRSDDDRVPEWVAADDVKYQPIVITRANVRDIADNFNRDRDGNPKTKTVAFVNFFFADDETEQPFVFKTGWLAIRNAVNAWNDLTPRPYPIACGLTEMLNRPAIAGHFPLRFSPPDQLEIGEDAAQAYSLQQTEPNNKPLYNKAHTAPAAAPAAAPAGITGEPTPPADQPTAPAAPSTSRPGRTSAARASGGSVSNNLRTRGN